MSARAGTLRVTVSLPTKVPALGLKTTVSELDCAGGDDQRGDEQVSRTRTSTAWRTRRVHVLLALDIRAIQPWGSVEHRPRNQAKAALSRFSWRKAATNVSPMLRAALRALCRNRLRGVKRHGLLALTGVQSGCLS